MTALTKLEEKADELIATNQSDEIETKITQLKNYLGNDGYSVAKIWNTTPINPKTALGKRNRFDALTLVHSSKSERDLAEVFYDDLKEISLSSLVNKAVKVEIDGYPMTVVPTKFAQQGTIGVSEKGILDLAEIVGEDKLLHQGSALIQYWQYQSGLDEETEILLPYEIELTLTHLIQEYEPENLEELMSQFFKFGEQKRFANQINVFDKHGNILLYHDFMIPNKQEFLEKLFAANKKFNSDSRDLSIFGI